MNKIQRLGLGLITASVSTLMLTEVALADVDENFSKRYPFDNKGVISVENINGKIEIEGWDEDEILLEYTITADDKDGLERINVDVDVSDSRFSVDVDFSSQKKGWFSWGGSSSGEVEFRLKVPSQAFLKGIDSVNGNINIEKVLGEIKAETVNGRIVIENAGSDVSTDTVNGNIKIVMDRFSGSQRIKGESVNGDIVVYLPANGGFRLNAETLNGDLANDFGIEVDEGEYVGAEMSGRYKDGDGRLSFDTVNGDIEVKQR
ncbi:DUF4097 family beta strand repeat-containing protein [Kangiella sp. TOML190]|uniref:DUF4097 family beta strand repeat-containing protein n=1 Tax=Kangiella sp. TOML190 TaxID=2931351 RepID=UPI00203D587C|nr:DUF4097 family beta strand repeat-containing protein [Kangiella sp. TOML190]